MHVADPSKVRPREKTSPLLPAALLLILAACGGGSGGDELPPTLDLAAEADAFVCSDDWADDNYGTAQFSPRGVGQQNDFTGNQVGRQLYRFVAPSALAGTTVATATLRLKLYDNFAGFPMDVEVVGAGDVWSETGVTWVSQPATEGAALGGTTVVCCGGIYEFDVTAYVNAQLAAGDVTFSFVLRSADEGTIGGLRWWMREGDGADINMIVGETPRLIVDR